MIKTFNEYIKESYNNLGFIKSRSNYYLINESQESKSQSEAIKLVMDKWGWDKAKADNFIRVDLRNDITPLRDKQIGKFTLGITRMYLNNEITDANIISDINDTLKLLTAHLNEYDRNLNGLSAEELISKFKRVRENNVKKEKKEIKRIKFCVSDYEIVKIDSYDDAQKYYRYTYPGSRWCLTHMENMYDSYTCDGINQIYFCLKHGFEDIKPVVGENAPLDEYGLSMLSIIVNEEGELAYCTTRWNHDNEGDDNAMNAVEISEVVNVNFYEVFKPNTKWKDMINNVKRRLSNGESPENVFDECIRCENGNIIVEIIIKKNHDYEYDDDDEYDEIYKYNIINKDGSYLLNTWADYIDNYVGDYARVYLNGKYNFIDKNGEYLFDKLYDYLSDFKDGYAKVKLNGKYNFIDKNGEFMSDEWFGHADDFKDGCAKV